VGAETAGVAAPGAAAGAGAVDLLAQPARPANSAAVNNKGKIFMAAH
jgi:hypothetical protein